MSQNEFHRVAGNIFNSGADILVNPVNCVGVMGKGLALQFKNRYPSYFESYKRMCDRGLISPGVISHTYIASDGIAIVSFPTKLHWKNPSELGWITSGLISMRDYVDATYPNHESIAIPPLGAGLGGLNHETVGVVVERVLSDWRSHQNTFDIYYYESE